MNIGPILKFKFPDGGFLVRDLADGNGPFIDSWDRPEPLPTTEQLQTWEVEFLAAKAQKDLTAAVQRHLDATARKRLYDGILSLCSYATSTDPKFGAEGQAGVAWRDAVWSACYAIMAEVQAGTRPIPTEAELLAELPAFTWPDEV